MDMKASCVQLLKIAFPNTKIVTDRFHIIQHISRSFNTLRIKEMNQLKRHNQEEGKQYRKVKALLEIPFKKSTKYLYFRI